MARLLRAWLAPFAGDGGHHGLGLDEELRGFANGLFAQVAACIEQRMGDARAEPLQDLGQTIAHGGELAMRNAAMRMVEQRGGHHGAGGNRRGAIDLGHHPVRQSGHEGAALGGMHGGVSLFAQRGRGIAVGANVPQRHDFAELDVEATVAAAQNARCFEQAARILFLFFAAGELTHVRRTLDEPVVTDRHRDEEELLVRHRHRRFNDHVQEAELGGQELARARAAALQEKFDGEPLADQAAHVASTTAPYRRSPLNERRMKKAPPRRRMRPSGKKERLSPAAMSGSCRSA